MLGAIATHALPTAVPYAAIPWGDLHRSGYHQGISHLHQLYTRRNLAVFADMWGRVEAFPRGVQEALRFWLLSYNASHATIMTRVVAKQSMPDLAVTSAQPGVMYVSGLPVEKNLFLGLRRKLKTIVEAFRMLHGLPGNVKVFQRSSTSVSLPSGTVDYIFTDPPFGANIPYAELNFINEAWLGKVTDKTDEAIVSTSQGKSIEDYRTLLTASFTEMRRILKPTGRATLVFHSAAAEVWNALQRAYSEAGFDVLTAGVLNKTQGSFKQVTTDGAVRGDPMLLLGPRATGRSQPAASVWQVASELYREAAAAPDAVELSPQRLYSRLVNHFLSRHQLVPVDAQDFYSWYGRYAPEGD
ncbi:hypothetical protein [Devosia sp. Root413D1]|uniref:hypothetical protein n=1 Tax=Devosia sp. Root413D1 TaxID=1736531 RepID=UPI001FCD465E|nr:hypothetical protein [Devosia sp. Root413D1]